MWHGSIGVTYHDVNDTEGVVSAVLNLFSTLEKDNSVLIEAFYTPTAAQDSGKSMLPNYRVR